MASQTPTHYPLPNDLRIGIDRALTCKSCRSDSDKPQAVKTEIVCHTMASAIDSDAAIPIDVDDIFGLFGQGRISLGYGQAFVREGAVIKACKASIVCVHPPRPESKGGRVER